MEWLNEYLAGMAQIVIEHNAVVDKFIGDAVMAVFGVPFPSTDEETVKRDAKTAVRCATAMAEELDRLNEKWLAEGAPRIGMRIGLHTGLVVAGSLGSQNRMDYTVIGDTVNTASRLESYGRNLNGEAGSSNRCTIVISEATMKLIVDEVDLEAVGKIELKGKSQPIGAYRVLHGAASKSAGQ